MVCLVALLFSLPKLRLLMHSILVLYSRTLLIIIQFSCLNLCCKCRISLFSTASFYISGHNLIDWLLFMNAALLAYKTVPGTKKLKKLVHLALQFLAMFLCLIGLWAVWKFHDERKIDHLYTLHSWLGLTCIIFFSLQVDYVI